mmetsp:Transcript_19018/g.62153  ORF Transcript_19018/g.62153 Transcript_19018/m.62153 type:complete len:126 (+) Transcript_19018:1001-1378(+)
MADRASYHDFNHMSRMLGIVNCGLLALGPYRSTENGIEFVYHMEQCYICGERHLHSARSNLRSVLGGCHGVPERVRKYCQACARALLSLKHRVLRVGLEERPAPPHLPVPPSPPWIDRAHVPEDL